METITLSKEVLKTLLKILTIHKSNLFQMLKNGLMLSKKAECYVISFRFLLRECQDK